VLKGSELKGSARYRGSELKVKIPGIYHPPLIIIWGTELNKPQAFVHGVPYQYA
jgi:hypothetical protein